MITYDNLARRIVAEHERENILTNCRRPITNYLSIVGTHFVMSVMFCCYAVFFAQIALQDFNALSTPIMFLSILLFEIFRKLLYCIRMLFSPHWLRSDLDIRSGLIYKYLPTILAGSWCVLILISVAFQLRTRIDIIQIFIGFLGGIFAGLMTAHLQLYTRKTLCYFQLEYFYLSDIGTWLGFIMIPLINSLCFEYNISATQAILSAMLLNTIGMARMTHKKLIEIRRTSRSGISTVRRILRRQSRGSFEVPPEDSRSPRADGRVSSLLEAEVIIEPLPRHLRSSTEEMDKIQCTSPTTDGDISVQVPPEQVAPEHEPPEGDILGPLVSVEQISPGQSSLGPFSSGTVSLDHFSSGPVSMGQASSVQVSSKDVSSDSSYSSSDQVTIQQRQIDTGYTVRTDVHVEPLPGYLESENSSVAAEEIHHQSESTGGQEQVHVEASSTEQVSWNESCLDQSSDEETSSDPSNIRKSASVEALEEAFALVGRFFQENPEVFPPIEYQSVSADTEQVSAVTIPPVQVTTEQVSADNDGQEEGSSKGYINNVFVHSTTDTISGSQLTRMNLQTMIHESDDADRIEAHTESAPSVTQENVPSSTSDGFTQMQHPRIEIDSGAVQRCAESPPRPPTVSSSQSSDEVQIGPSQPVRYIAHNANRRTPNRSSSRATDDAIQVVRRSPEASDEIQVVPQEPERSTHSESLQRLREFFSSDSLEFGPMHLVNYYCWGPMKKYFGNPRFWAPFISKTLYDMMTTVFIICMPAMLVEKNYLTSTHDSLIYLIFFIVGWGIGIFSRLSMHALCDQYPFKIMHNHVLFFIGHLLAATSLTFYDPYGMNLHQIHKSNKLAMMMFGIAHCLITYNQGLVVQNIMTPNEPYFINGANMGPLLYVDYFGSHLMLIIYISVCITIAYVPTNIGHLYDYSCVIYWINVWIWCIYYGLEKMIKWYHELRSGSGMFF